MVKQMDKTESQVTKKEELLAKLNSMTPKTRMVVLGVIKEMKEEQRKESANRIQVPKDDSITQP